VLVGRKESDEYLSRSNGMWARRAKSRMQVLVREEWIEYLNRCGEVEVADGRKKHGVGKRPGRKGFNMLGWKERVPEQQKTRDGIPTVRKLEAAEAAVLDDLLGEETTTRQVARIVFA
jgi:hypothetical protein